ncbi:hypothetical protein GCM10023322_83440 [Rugosimonospora acidiphila]|uniref:Uncharacterized protein n=1 Tax=Rugosimonospora acidiphila TaxID=556531 RepID=A0ABP9SWP7_9ACTN
MLAGQRHALSPSWQIDRLDHLWRHHPPGSASTVITIAAAPALAGLAGTAATLLGEDVVHPLWTTCGPLSRLFKLRRQTRAAWHGRQPRPPIGTSPDEPPSPPKANAAFSLFIPPFSYHQQECGRSCRAEWR